MKCYSPWVESTVGAVRDWSPWETRFHAASEILQPSVEFTLCFWFKTLIFSWKYTHGNNCGLIQNSTPFQLPPSLLPWACLVKGFNTLVTAGGLNLPDKRADPNCWLRSGFESPRRQLGFKPLPGSHQLRTLHCWVMLACASLGG